jgi:hypothetical protein
MRKWTMVLLAVVALAGGSLMAANISNLSGQSCGTGSGDWHFINNQTGGTQVPGTLTATFLQADGTTVTCTAIADPVLNNTQHFNCIGFSGTLTSASTDLNGRLVLSDFSCGPPKEEPPCVPTKENPCK